MRNIFYLIFIFFPTLLFSQKWEFKKLGNSFDGFGKTAGILISEGTDQQTLLAVLNKSDELNLVWGANKKNGINNLSVRLLIPSEITPQKVLMAFDEERTYYQLNFSYSDNLIFIENAITPDFKSFLTLLDIISFFKLKKTVHFRVITENSKFNYSFPLRGSVAALGKTFNCPSYKKAGNLTDAIFEYLYFQLMFSKIDNGKKNFTSMSPTCFDYLRDKYGLYFFTQIKSIESKSNESFPTFIFKNELEDIVAEITKESYLKDYFHFSGNPKRDESEKIKKDIETIKLYYEAFQKYTSLITNNNITLEKFSNFSKIELLTYYKSILNNKIFLDYVRSNEFYYYHYEANKYTFEVFMEAWGE